MVFKSSDQNAKGTFLQGYMPASYKQLELIFGKPIEETDGYKVSTEWILENEKGDTITNL